MPKSKNRKDKNRQGKLKQAAMLARHEKHNREKEIRKQEERIQEMLQNYRQQKDQSRQEKAAAIVSGESDTATEALSAAMNGIITPISDED